MRTIEYRLRPRSGAWVAHPDARSPEQRLLRFDLTVERAGTPLGGHNVQAVVGAPDQTRYGLDEDVAMWLPSGWWVSLRNEFANAPDVAVRILGSAVGELSAVTAEATTARGSDADGVSERLFATTFAATGPDYWR